MGRCPAESQGQQGARTVGPDRPHQVGAVIEGGEELVVATGLEAQQYRRPVDLPLVERRLTERKQSCISL